MPLWTAVFVLALGAGARGLGARAQDQSPAPPMGGMGSQAGKIAAQVPAPTGPLDITFGAKSGEWTPATLAALPHKTITLYNEHAKANQTYSGVLLIDLLTPLGVPAKPHGEDFALYLVAGRSDGYQVVYSVAEVNPDVQDSTVIVADALDGQPLADKGPLQLGATGQKRPARWVRNLIAIRVLTVQ
jgi:hypothetical protein